MPVDVVSGETLSNVGVTEINQTLSIMLPSFNFPRPGLADGTDTIRPATLRGLSPDQTLVMLNSKRRHASSLVNVNGTIGRGAAAVDLNTIPSAIVQSIEVLRDGASAQYGSDAIAGVINVRLKQDDDGGDVMVAYGARDFDYDIPVSAAPAGATWPAPSSIGSSGTDGESLTVSGWKGLGFGETGYVTLAAEYKDQERTERGGYDFRQQYPLVGSAFDPREAAFDRFNAWYGEPELEQLTFFANGGGELDGGVFIYGWASYQDRESRSAGFFRRALDDRNVIQIYPDGFLPIIAPEVTDYSAAAGATWDAGDWALDTSLTFGTNEMQFGVENTLNRSMGTASPTTFDAGGFTYDQLVLNFSAVRAFDVGAFASPLNVATGLEAREETYSIFAGEPSSYINGGVLLPNGSPTASGAQVFPGFRPANVTDADRTAIGAYVDLEANLTEKFLGSAALRAEDYSDFGSNVSGKVAATLRLHRLVRAARLRADGLSRAVAAAAVLRDDVDELHRRHSVRHHVVPRQRPHRARARRAGSRRRGGRELLVRRRDEVRGRDADDRRVQHRHRRPHRALREPHAGQRARVPREPGLHRDRRRALLHQRRRHRDARHRRRAHVGVRHGQGRPIRHDDRGEPQRHRCHARAGDRAARRAESAAAAVRASQRADLRRGQPGQQARRDAELERQRLIRCDFPRDALRRGARPRSAPHGHDRVADRRQDAVIGAQTVIDIEGRFEPSERLRIAIGAENLLDEFPDAFPVARNATGNTPFSNYAPFGRSGRYVYGRVTFGF